MDGTISPIPRDFLETPVPPPTVPQLTELASRFDLLAVISGRKAGALREIIDIPGIKYIGHYGMEWWENGQAVLHPDVTASLSYMRAVAAELETLRSIDGVIIQDKWASISVHYNTTQQPSTAKQQILDFLEKSPHIKNLRRLAGIPRYPGRPGKAGIHGISRAGDRRRHQSEPAACSGLHAGRSARDRNVFRLAGE